MVRDQFLYLDQLRPSAWLDGSGDLKATFIYLTGRIAPDVMITDDGSRYRLIQDERGSVRLVVNTATGDIAQQIAYDPWGRELTNTAPAFQPFGYAGGITDRATSLVHFGAREYHPSTGRFLQRDPIEDSTGDPYSYAGSDPINSFDPTGLCSCTSSDGSFRSGVAAASAGIGDTLSFGLLKGLRNKLGGGVDECSDDYKWGGYGGIAIGIGLGGVAGAGRGAAAGAGTGGAEGAATGAGRTTIVGRSGNPMTVPGGTNVPTTIGGRGYTGHALDQMQGRGFVPSVVENVIQNGASAGSRGGTTVFTFEGTTVVTNSSG